MNLGMCIANLLQRYQAVAVPGIGVFRQIHEPAFYNEDRSLLHPPSIRVELVRTQQDVLPITEYLRVQGGIDEPAAIQAVARAVHEVMEIVSQKGEALLDGLGYLLLEGSVLQFKPINHGRLNWRPISAPAVHPEAEGTPAADPILTDDATQADTVGTAEAIPSVPPEATAMAETPAIVESADVAPVTTAAVPDVNDETASTPNRSTGWWVAAAILVIVGAGAWIWYYRPDWGSRFASSQAVPGEQVAQAPTVDGGQHQPVAAVPGSTATDTLPVTTVTGSDNDSVLSKPAVPMATTPRVTYEIIVGSFATMAQAEKYIAQMKEKGYELQALDSRMPGNRKKVSWGSYATEEEAYRELARVQKTFEPGAWIAKIERD